MAALSIAVRTQIRRGCMRYWSNLPSGDTDKSVSATKYELYNPNDNTGMIADVDNWIDTHSANTSADTVGLNGGINANYRAKFTTGQKGVVVMAVSAARTGNLNLLRGALGTEVD